MPQESEKTPAPNHKPDLEVGITVGAGHRRGRTLALECTGE